MKGTPRYHCPRELENIFELETYEGIDTCTITYPCIACVEYPITKSLVYIMNLKSIYLRDLLITEINHFMIQNNKGSLLDRKEYYENLKPIYIITLRKILIPSRL